MYQLDYKLAFIVPYRNRKEHLEKFVPHYKKLFPCANIYIVHQLGNAPFNRGKLLNIGFLFAENRADAFDLSDVDMLAVEGQVDYSFPTAVTHLASAVSQFNYQLPYFGYFSGHILLTPKHMRTVNGFYNGYAGWGCEDDCFLRSCLAKEVPVERRYGKYESLPHEQIIDHSLYENNLAIMKRPRDFNSGLSSCEYSIDEIIETENYTIINVNI